MEIKCKVISEIKDEDTEVYKNTGFHGFDFKEPVMGKRIGSLKLRQNIWPVYCWKHLRKMDYYVKQVNP